MNIIPGIKMIQAEEEIFDEEILPLLQSGWRIEAFVCVGDNLRGRKRVGVFRAYFSEPEPTRKALKKPYGKRRRP